MSHIKLIISIAAAALAGAAGAQTTSDTTGRTAGQATRDAANAVGRAASAAVTPGDQNMGRNPDNRSGGLMGNDRTATDGTNPDTSTNRVRRTARADRG